MSVLRNPNDPNGALGTDAGREAQSDTNHHNETIMVKILSIFYKKNMEENKTVNMKIPNM